MRWHIPPGSIPASAWTERLSDVCAVCNGSSAAEHEGLAELHRPDCEGCPICELSVRLFRELADGRVLGVALHFNCLMRVIVRIDGNPCGPARRLVEGDP